MSKYDKLIKIYNERGNDYCTPLDLTIPYIEENLKDIKTKTDALLNIRHQDSLIRDICKMLVRGELEEII